MNQLSIELQNCYGINKIVKEINFRTNDKTCVIYASNGTMKSSLANTFKDIVNGEETKDLIFKDNTTLRSIKKDQKDIQPDEILVIEPYVESFASENMSKLLVSSKLKKEYDNILLDINKFKDELMRKIKSLSKITNAEEEFIKYFSANEDDDILSIFEKIYNEKLIEENVLFDHIKYKDCVNDDVKNALMDPVVVQALGEYVEKYDEMMKDSEIYVPGVYDDTRADQVLKSLQSNNYFKAHNKIALKNGKVLTEDEYKQEIEAVENRILNDKKIKENYKVIDKALTKKASLKNFKDSLTSNQKIIPYLVNYNIFVQKILLNYLYKCKLEFTNFISVYAKNKKTISDIIQKAKEEKTIWEEVTKLFKERFSVPFEIYVENQKDVILKEDSLSLKFIYTKRR